MQKIILSIIVIIFVACGKSDEKKVSELYQQAITFYDNHNFVNAKIIIDTIHSKYPLMVNYRKKADTLFWKITIDEINEHMPTIDSILQNSTKKAELIAKNYTFRKEEKFQQLGDYEHNSMQNAFNTNRTFLKPITDENGSFRLISNYVGAPIKHRQVVVKAENASATSSKVTEQEVNTYNDFGVNYELVYFNDSTCRDIISFFAVNYDKQIEVVLQGEKDFSYKIQKSNVKIILETLEFAKILRDIHKNQAKKTTYTNMYNSLIVKLSK